MYEYACESRPSFFARDGMVDTKTTEDSHGRYVRAHAHAEKKMRELLDTTTGSYLAEDVAVKETLLLDLMEDFDVVAKGFDDLKELSGYVNSPRLEDREKWETRMRTIVERQREIERRTKAYRARLSNVLTFYHQSMNALSLKFISCDKTLREIEKQRGIADDKDTETW